MKPLSFEGLYECGALELAKGKVCAFVAVLDSEHGGVRMGLAVANEPGYYPIPHFWCYGDGSEREAMHKHADALNREHFELAPDAAARVIASTMRPMGERKRKPNRPGANRPGDLPADPDGENDNRSVWAGSALREFRKVTGTDECDAVCDLVCDLMHWCDRNGQDFDAELRRARGHYTEETTEERT